MLSKRQLGYAIVISCLLLGATMHDSLSHTAKPDQHSAGKNELLSLLSLSHMVWTQTCSTNS